VIRRVRVGGKTRFRVVAHKSGRNLGTYATRAAAEERLRRLRRYHYRRA
jgi:hypothetical protein